ncbi:helix-turn-helix domain-containing protein [Arhodomonas sp. AD133]|uniref:helix-turn-helix domain-containing protein n=1 Tax=Arhodomonas sp. AD133 TaxID=3415009 RepID=UPI003EBA0B0F
MSAQIIEREGRPEYAVIPYDEYQDLLRKAEELDDVTAFDRATRELEEGRDEVVPGDVVDRLLAGENPVKVWREHRRLTQTELAEQAGVSQSYVAMIERGDRTGRVDALRKIAGVLEVDLDDLLEESPS